MTAVHQFVPALLPRDATGDHTRALRDALRAAGVDSDVYVEAAHDELTHEARHFEEYPARARPGDVLLYQLGTASPVAAFLLGRPEPLVLDYHNVTPPSFYEGWEEHTVAKVTAALDQVAALAPRAVLGIADSAFNAADLAALGCPATAVLPILVDREGWAATADPLEADRLAAAHRGSVLLFVGRLSPNKAQHRLVETLWLYRRWFDPDAVLHLVGPSPTPGYEDAVTAFAAELGLAGAVRRGRDLSPARLAAWYADADVFCCLSGHEGFCIPLLEAWHADLPVVAHAAGAVPETLGDAGLLLPTDRPAAAAVAAHRLVADRALATRLVAAGRRRRQRFAAGPTAARFVEVLTAVADGRGVAA